MKLPRPPEEAPSGPSGTERPQEKGSRPKLLVEQKLSEVTEGAVHAIGEGPVSALLEAALEYVARGWRVLPLWTPDSSRSTGCACPRSKCDSPGKHTLASYGDGPGHVFNLGHGITPDIDPDNLGVLVDAVHELSPDYHP